MCSVFTTASRIAELDRHRLGDGDEIIFPPGGVRRVKAGAVVCGAGIAGVATAFQLAVEQGMR